MRPETDQLLHMLKALADPVRLRLAALCRQGDCSVSELTAVLGLSQPRVSQHLKQLCDAGLLERFRDGQRVYYRVSAATTSTAAAVLPLLPEGEPAFVEDAARLRKARAAGMRTPAAEEPQAGTAERRHPDTDRALHRAFVDLTVTAPLGDLLDVGCGRGRLMKLLGSRANRAIGVDIDASARDVARAELLFADLPNCSLRAGDMYRLPFDDAEFDTVILDDVLADAAQPVAALREGRRTLRPGGRLLILQSIDAQGVPAAKAGIAAWCGEAELRLAPARTVPGAAPRWLLAVARPINVASAAA